MKSDITRSDPIIFFTYIFSHILWSFCANNAWGLGRFITTCFRYIWFDYLNKKLEVYRERIK